MSFLFVTMSCDAAQLWMTKWRRWESFFGDLNYKTGIYFSTGFMSRRQYLLTYDATCTTELRRDVFIRTCGWGLGCGPAHPRQWTVCRPPSTADPPLHLPSLSPLTSPTLTPQSSPTLTPQSSPTFQLLPPSLPPTINSSHHHFLPQSLPPTTTSSHTHFLPQSLPLTLTSSHNRIYSLLPINFLPITFLPQ